MLDKEENAISGKKAYLDAIKGAVHKSLDVRALVSASGVVFAKEGGEDFTLGIKKSGLLKKAEDSSISPEDFNLKLKGYASNFHKYRNIYWDQTPLKRDSFPSYL